MRLVHTLGTLNPHTINERFTFNLPSVVPDLLTYFFSHISILLLPFVFLNTYLIALSISASLYNHLYLSTMHTFTRRRTTIRNVSLNYFHYGVKLISLSNCFYWNTNAASHFSLHIFQYHFVFVKQRKMYLNQRPVFPVTRIVRQDFRRNLLV